MSLKLRRGTDAQRLVITPVEGELIYATDTKQIYVGDGTTLGGNAINNPLGLTPDLEGLTFTPAGHLTIKNQTANSDFNINVKPQGVDTNIISIDGTTGAVSVKRSLNVSRGITGDLTGSLFADDSTKIIDGVNSRGYFSSVNATAGINGDLTGSVFANDSSLIIDGNDGRIFTTVIDSPTGTLELLGNASGDTNLIITDNTNGRPLMKLRRFITGIMSPTRDLGLIVFERFDDNGIAARGTIGGRNGDMYMAMPNSLGAFPTNQVFWLTQTGLFGFGKYPDSSIKFDFNGDGRFSSGLTTTTLTASGYVQFGSYTSTQRNALTATNGMVIYNTSDNRFQGRQNGAWINLDDGTAAA